jgi:membrane protein required for colicin V production
VLVSFGGLFMLVMLLGGFLNYIVGKAIEKGGISGTDRMLGMLFGTLRGVAVVLVLVLLVGFTTMSQEDWWQESRLIPWFESAAEWVKQYFPEDVLEHLPPSPEQTET